MLALARKLPYRLRATFPQNPLSLVRRWKLLKHNSRAHKAPLVQYLIQLWLHRAKIFPHPVIHTVTCRPEDWQQGSCRFFHETVVICPRELWPLLLVLKDNVVHDAVVFSLVGVHDEIAFDVPFHLFQRLAAVLGEQLVRDLAHAQDFTRMDIDVRRLS